MGRLEKAIKKQDAKRKEHCRSNSDSDSEYGIKLGSIGKVQINLGESIKKTKFTPPSPMKASTLNIFASKNNDMCQTSVSNADDITVTQLWWSCRGKSIGHGWEVTQHGQAQPYSWLSTIVNLQV